MASTKARFGELFFRPTRSSGRFQPLQMRNKANSPTPWGAFFRVIHVKISPGIVNTRRHCPLANTPMAGVPLVCASAVAAPNDVKPPKPAICQIVILIENKFGAVTYVKYHTCTLFLVLL
jgi:hypothetical protein